MHGFKHKAWLWPLLTLDGDPADVRAVLQPLELLMQVHQLQARDGTARQLGNADRSGWRGGLRRFTGRDHRHGHSVDGLDRSC
jgi:hypothetical protein